MIYFIAEIGSNFNQSFDRACKLIDLAAESKFNAVKFQLFRAEELTTIKKDQEFFKKCELNPNWISRLFNYTKHKGLEFGMTFYHKEDIKKYGPICDFIKISSSDCLRMDLIGEAALYTAKRLIISTGLMSLKEIEIMNIKFKPYLYLDKGVELVFLHCVVEYPAKDGQLGFLREMIKQNSYTVGYSDHTADFDTLREAIIIGAKYVECHIDLPDCEGRENIGHCWTPWPGFASDFQKYESEIQFKILTPEKLNMRADPEDGKRPMKGAR